MNPASQAVLPHGRPLPRLGFGASSYWAKHEFNADLAMEVALTAVGAGIKYIDTGPSYANGEAERRVGRLVAHVGAEQLVVSTKFGTSVDTDGHLRKDFRPQQVLPSLHQSLKRLNLERVDILLLHSPRRDDLTDELFAALKRTVEQGQVGAIGLWSHDAEVHGAALNWPFDVHMLQYNFVDRSMRKALDELKDHRRIIINGTALAQGILKPMNFIPRDRRSTWYLMRLLKNNPMFLWHYFRLRAAAAKYKLPLLETAIQSWLLHPAIHCGVFGSTRAEHVLANLAAVHRLLGEKQPHGL